MNIYDHCVVTGVDPLQMPGHQHSLQANNDYCVVTGVDSLQTPSHQHSLQVNKGDFWCPLCRRLANSALPILPDPAPATSVLPQSDVEVVHYIASTMATRPVTSVSGAYIFTQREMERERRERVRKGRERGGGERGRDRGCGCMHV